VGRWEDYKESRIASYKFEGWIDGDWKTLANGSDPSAVRILRIPRVSAARVRVTIEGRRDSPNIADFGVYDEPA
jgi:hypothetical protein